MQILCKLAPPAGAELSLKLKYPYLKDYNRFYFFYQFFYKWSLDDAKELNF